MKSICDNFSYYNGDTASVPGSGYVATIPLGIDGVEQLFDVLFQVLKLPGYFGFNWNALSDCLRDLSWVPEREVVIVHRELPHLNDDDIKLYLDVLCEAARDWKPSENHKLVIFFPISCRDRIVSLLSATDG